MKSRIYQLVDSINDEPALEQLLNDANHYVSENVQPPATLENLTATQRERLEQAIEQHKTGKTLSHEDVKQRYRQWLTE